MTSASQSDTQDDTGEGDLKLPVVCTAERGSQQSCDCKFVLASWHVQSTEVTYVRNIRLTPFARPFDHRRVVSCNARRIQSMDQRQQRRKTEEEVQVRKIWGMHGRILNRTSSFSLADGSSFTAQHCLYRLRRNTPINPRLLLYLFFSRCAAAYRRNSFNYQDTSPKRPSELCVIDFPNCPSKGVASQAAPA